MVVKFCIPKCNKCGFYLDEDIIPIFLSFLIDFVSKHDENNDIINLKHFLRIYNIIFNNCNIETMKDYLNRHNINIDFDYDYFYDTTQFKTDVELFELLFNSFKQSFINLGLYAIYIYISLNNRAQTFDVSLCQQILTLLKQFYPYVYDSQLHAVIDDNIFIFDLAVKNNQEVMII